ncbi:bifunctional metallophosphatase/5'-nucleotidase [Motilibacter aurantiacus]|uniref:bifunctional metallophosphatase/5'-nucleotidase n=1 Tax=Motilibacter aurantiacus TaxID=2714955 RepID=UPI001409CF92|nr:bifunctional metallophosphatase/5'-nucleotidase [Motilibacter aurantiacus]NHC46861.1 bifunctional metallophosphatase/5'-nucleotidase [Motilibacter aurantiacus]
MTPILGRVRPRAALLAAAAGAVLAATAMTAVPADAVSVTSQPLQHIQLLAVNDFHGNLEPPTGSGGTVNPGGGQPAVPAGGAAYLSTHLKQLRAGKKDSFTIGTGDMIGASPLLSAAFHDEPTIEAMNLMGVELSAVGNHEFDEGYAELLRMQKGGCIRDEAGADNQNSCAAKDLGGKRFRGADFDYLAGNVEFTADGSPLMAATHVEKFHNGAKVGFIGVVTSSTPSIVTASGIRGLSFKDEAQVINKHAAQLQARGVEAIVVLMHEGGSGGSAYNGCSSLGGAARGINANVTSAVDVIVTGHSHSAFNCKAPDPAGNPRLVTQAGNYGRLVTDIDLVIDRRTGDVDRQATKAENVIVTRTVTPDAQISDLMNRYRTYLGPIATRTIGYIGSDITRSTNSAGESALGDLLADSVRADPSIAGGGPIDIAFMNPGGIRADLPKGDGAVTYEEAFAVQPFSNYNVSKTYTGAQVKQILEAGRLPVSGLTYTFTASAPAGNRVSNVLVGGRPLELGKKYRVGANNFLIEGGDGYATFAEGTDPLYGGVDIDGFARFLSANSSATAPYVVPGLNRITRLP